MRVLEVKTIDHGSTDYVASMLLRSLAKYCQVGEIESVKKMKMNPVRFLRGVREIYLSDILHCHLGGAAKFVGALSKSKIKVATFHGFQKAKHYKYIDNFTAVSEAVKNHFVNQGVSEERIVVIPNGVEEKFFEVKSKKDGIFTICQVGNLNKNLELSFQCMSLLKKSGFKIRFLVAGSGVDVKSFYSVLKDLNIYDDVEFLGFVNNVEEVYGKSDLVIGTSHKEGFHLPILEGMASGLPVVTTDSLGVRDFFQDRKNGFFAEPNPYDFFKKIKVLYENQEMRISFGKFNRKASYDYTWDRVSSKYYEFFKYLYEKRHSLRG